MYTFACTIGSFIDDDWKIVERIVDFKPLAEKEHQGLQGGLAFVNGARAIGGLNKMSHTQLITNVMSCLLTSVPRTFTA